MVLDSFFSQKDKRIFEGNRSFVDREEYIQAFKDALENIKEKERSVLIYHGVAGIGKTSLRKEFNRIIEECNELHKNSRILWAMVNFETKEFRQPQKFLEILRDQFQDNYGIKFYTFDIAHALYWSKVNPRVPLSRENYSKNSIITNLLDIGDNLSGAYVGFSPAKLISDVINLVNKFPDLYNDWVSKNIEEVSSLIYMEPSEIEKRLYLYWAYDLHEYLQKTSEAVVIFIDSYEALWGKDRSLSKLSSEDQWIRKLIQKLLSSSCIWVLCGQEFPQWEKWSNSEKALWGNSIEWNKIKGLPEENARYLLECYDILEKNIQDTIINSSKGVPYYLDLSIDTYKNIKEIREPDPDDFAKVPEEVFKRFISYLDENKEAVIKVLSVPNFWNHELFNLLIKEFTNYPPNGLATIHRFSFIDEDEINEGKWSMHQLMRQSWKEYQEKNELYERKNVHAFMFNYYENKLEKLDIKKITQEHKTSLVEAFYHAKEVLGAEDLFNWFIITSNPFNEAAFWQLIIPMYEELLQILEAKLGSEHPDIAAILNNLAELYRHMGSYDQALPFYQKALEIYEKVLSPEHPDTATILNNLAGLYESMGDYKQALPLYQRALDIRESVLGPQHPDVANSLNNLAELYHQMGSYDQALPFYQRALDIRKSVLGPKHLDVANSLNNLAELYKYVGDYKQALPFYQGALEICENVLGSQHPYVATTLNNLAGLHYRMGEYKKALTFHQRALNIRENIMGPNHPSVANSLNNLALLYNQMGDYKKALPLHQKALCIRENVLGPKHPAVATTLNNLALLYYKIGDYDQALPLYQRALEICENVLGSQHPFFATTLNNLAGLYHKMSSYDQALLLYQWALDIRENVLGPQHPDVAETLNNLALLYESMGAYDKALPLYQRALEIYENLLGSKNPNTLTIRSNLEQLISYMERKEEN